LSWRIRPQQTISGDLRWLLDGNSFTKKIAAGDNFRYHSPKRTRSLIELIRYPLERPLPDGPVQWIVIDYPPSPVRMLGIEAHWSIWFLAFSLVGAMISPER